MTTPLRLSLPSTLAAFALAAAGLAAVSGPAAAAPGGVAGAPPVECIRNADGTRAGTDGHRLQVYYATEPGAPSRLAERLPAIRQAMWEAQTNVNDSGRREGAGRSLRFHHDENCQVTITPIAISAAETQGPDYFGALRAKGLNAPNRLYVIISETFTGCGVTNWDGNAAPGVAGDTTKGPGNLHNSAASWVTINAQGCLNGHVATHEIAHALGAVIGGTGASPKAAPNADSGFHCTDGNETLCQPQGGQPNACPDPIAIRLLDCNHDDYFAIAPAPGTFLADYWNVARDSKYIKAGNATPVIASPLPLPPQYLQAVDVEGRSVAFAFRMPGDAVGIDAYEIVDTATGAVVATTPATTPAASPLAVAWAGTLDPATSYRFAARSRVGAPGPGARYSTLSGVLPVRTGLSSNTATAGVPENGAVMTLTNQVLDQGRPLAMDVGYGSLDENATVLQFPQNGALNEQWRFTLVSGSTYRLASVNSGKCLAATATGALVQRSCTSEATQQWTFAQISGLTHYIRSSTGLCIQSTGLSSASLTPLSLGTCVTTGAGQPTQRWTTNRLA